MMKPRWVWLYAISLMVLTSLPYAVALQQDHRLNPQAEWIFSGFVFGVTDGNSYIAKMRTGMEGAWLFRSPYTAMSQNGVIAFLPYILLGKLVVPPQVHLKLVILFHAFRILAGILNIWATYHFLTLFIEKDLYRKIALIMATAGGGLGWLLIFGRESFQLPLELYSPESFGFLSLYGLPHLALGRAALVWTLVAYLRFRQTFAPRAAFTFGGFLLLAGICQPIQAAMAAGIIALHWVTGWTLEQRKKLTPKNSPHTKTIFPLITGSLPAGLLLIYTALKFIGDPYLRIWTSQNILPAAPLTLYLTSYGWLMPLAFYGAFAMGKINPNRALLPVLWMIIGLAGICIPISIQRRLIEGFWVALVTLTFVFLDKPPHWLATSLQRIGAYGLLVFSLPSTLMLIVGGIQTAQHPAEPAFLPYEQVALFEWFNEQDLQVSPIVLASFDSSNALPAFASVRVLIGHGPESAGGKTFQQQVETVYHLTTTAPQRMHLLREYAVNYLVWGPSERALGEWDPHEAKYLQLVAEKGAYSLFQVTVQP